MSRAKIQIPKDKIAAFCRTHHLRRLALFGSVLRDDFRPDSDVDVLVEFEPGHPVGLIRLAGIERELSVLLGHKVDLNTAGFLSRYFRTKVLSAAEVSYDAACRYGPPLPHARPLARSRGPSPGEDPR